MDLYWCKKCYLIIRDWFYLIADDKVETCQDSQEPWRPHWYSQRRLNQTNIGSVCSSELNDSRFIWFTTSGDLCDSISFIYKEWLEHAKWCIWIVTLFFSFSFVSPTISQKVWHKIKKKNFSVCSAKMAFLSSDFDNSNILKITCNCRCVERRIRCWGEICIITCDVCSCEELCCIKMLFGCGKLIYSECKKKGVFCVSMLWNMIKCVMDFKEKNLAEVELEIKVFQDKFFNVLVKVK